MGIGKPSTCVDNNNCSSKLEKISFNDLKEFFSSLDEMQHGWPLKDLRNKKVVRKTAFTVCLYTRVALISEMFKLVLLNSKSKVQLKKMSFSARDLFLETI